MVDDITLLMIATSLFFLTVGLVVFVRVRSSLKVFSASHRSVVEVLSFIEDRLLHYERMLTDLGARVDIIEASTKASIHSKTRLKQAAESQQPLQPLNVELVVLRALSSGPKTVPEIRNIIARTREHTARLMKSLYERGLVTRNESKKPYSYELSEEGRKLLGTS